MNYLKNNPEIEKVNIKLLIEELKDLGAEEPVLIAFGNDAYKILKRNLEDDSRIIKIRYYSDFISEKDYKEETLKRLRN